MKRLFTGNEVENLLLAHKPALCTTVTNALQGKLPTQKFPTLQPFDYRDKPVNLIVFMVGGATYAEARELAVANNVESDRVIYGGTYMHNSRSFLAEVSQISQIRNGPGTASLEI